MDLAAMNVPILGGDKSFRSANFAHFPVAERATMTPLLAERVEKFGIVLPRARPVYDRMFVYPLEGRDESDTFAGTGIIKPKESKDLYGASRGVLVKAGMGALELLWSHGVELGHIVLVARLSPWVRKYEGKGKIHQVLVLRASELVGSDDLENDVIEGHVGFSCVDGRLEILDRPRRDPEENDEGI